MYIKKLGAAWRRRTGAAAVGRTAVSSADAPRFTFSAKLRHYRRAVSSYLGRRVVLSYLPEDISLEVTNVCNFRCSFCPQSDPDHHRHVPQSYLSPDRADVILQHLRNAGVRTKAVHWTHDGEPFVNKRFHAICEVAARHGFTDMYFATNGMLCTHDRLDALPRDQCTYTFTIDFSADKEVFESVRGTRGSWSRVRSNITRILNSTAYDHILVEIREISSFLTDDPNLLATREAHLRKMFPNSPRLRVLSKSFHNACGFLSTNKRSNRYHLCPYPWISVSIASNGNVVACSRDLRHRSILGNILHHNLWDIWNGDRMRELRRNLATRRPDLNGACEHCDMPYAKEKFSLRNIFRTLRGRLRLFNEE